MMVTAPRSAASSRTVLIIGLLLVLFPIYVAFVTRDVARTTPNAPMSLARGRISSPTVEALGAGTVKTSGQPVGR